MPYTPGLRVSDMPPRQQQAARYDNLASWAHKVLTVNGRRMYTEAGVRRQLVAARVLASDGTPHVKRLNALLKSLGFKGKPPSQMGWETIAEWGSP